MLCTLVKVSTFMIFGIFQKRYRRTQLQRILILILCSNF